MRRVPLLVAFATLTFAPAAPAQCPPGGTCHPSQFGPPVYWEPARVARPAAPPAAAPAYTWRYHPTDPNVAQLYRGDVLVGILDPEAASWRWTYDAKPIDLIVAVKGKPREARPAPAPPGRAEAPPAAKAAGPVCECDTCPGRGKPDCPCGCQGARPRPMPKADVREESDARVEDLPPARPAWALNGVDTAKLSTEPRYAIGGRDVAAAEGLSAIRGGGPIPADHDSPRLTVIGSDAACRQVLADLATSPELAAWRGKLVVNDYAPDHWRVKDGGFVTPRDASTPVIYVQAADGKVLWRQDDYAGGAPALRAALRDKVPGYDPNKDPSPKQPDPVKPDSPVGPDLKSINPWWLAVPAGLVLVLLLTRRTP